MFTYKIPLLRKIVNANAILFGRLAVLNNRRYSCGLSGTMNRSYDPRTAPATLEGGTYRDHPPPARAYPATATVGGSYYRAMDEFGLKPVWGIHWGIPWAWGDMQHTFTASQKVERQIVAIDLAIDKPIYELYELTDEEIAIVEQGGG